MSEKNLSDLSVGDDPKFTPGPWEVSMRHETSFNVRAQADSRALLRWRDKNPQAERSFKGVSICNTGVGYNGSGERFGPNELIDLDEVKANAALIASAPALYEALANLAFSYDNRDKGDGCWCSVWYEETYFERTGTHEATCQAARAALALVTQK